MQPPKATVLSLSRQRLAYRPETDEAVVQFVFDQPVTEWTVRINSTSHLDGTQAEALTPVADLGFGLMAFGRGPFGRVSEGTALAGQAKIEATMLLHGPNGVAIYGRGLDGRWTLPPVDRESVPS